MDPHHPPIEQHHRVTHLRGARRGTLGRRRSDNRARVGSEAAGQILARAVPVSARGGQPVGVPAELGILRPQGDGGPQAGERLVAAPQPVQELAQVGHGPGIVAQPRREVGHH